MFKELDDNLKSMNGEISKLQSAVEHIAQSKNAAEQAVKTAIELQTSFKTHLTSVAEDVSKILDPHKQLIKATETLTSTISAIDFPNRLDKQDKEIKLLKMLLFVACGLVLIGTVATILILIKQVDEKRNEPITRYIKHLAESANFKGSTFNKHRNGLTGNRFEMPNVSYTHPFSGKLSQLEPTYQTSNYEKRNIMKNR